MRRTHNSLRNRLTSLCKKNNFNKVNSKGIGNALKRCLSFFCLFGKGAYGNIRNKESVLYGQLPALAA